MRSFEDERLCHEAQVHYYDLLCQEEAAVPMVVRRHVATCVTCQDQMRRLREALFEAQRPPSPGAWQDETIEALAQQFQLLDERVTCGEVRPLLPELALASPQIRIPTPVTVHVDHCPQCAADLAAIRELHLPADQLKRLGRLLAAHRGVGLESVEGAGTIEAMKRGREAREAPDGWAPTVSGSLSSEDVGIACKDIAIADLFDSVVPSNAAPPEGETARARQRAIARHIQSCPACLRRARALQRTIRAIVARVDSEVVTVYHADHDVEESQREYPYPVSVQVLHSGSEAVGEARAVSAVRATGLRQLGRSAKPLAALAAVVLVAVVLTSFLRTTTPTASGTNLGDVDKILAGKNNIHIVTHDWTAKPIEEFWIARQSSILVWKTQEHGALYDLPRDRKTTIELQTGSRTSARLSKEDRDWARQVMASCVRDLVAEVSSDTRLRPAEGEMSRGTDTGLDIYELRLPSRARSSRLPSRRLLYIDRASGLPQRMELYRPMPGAEPDDPTTTKTFTYPDDQEMNKDIQALFPAE